MYTPLQFAKDLPYTVTKKWSYVDGYKLINSRTVPVCDSLCCIFCIYNIMNKQHMEKNTIVLLVQTVCYHKTVFHSIDNYIYISCISITN